MEKISALMDGELKSDEAAREFDRLRNAPENRNYWDTYHLIGDAMRGNALLSAKFAEGVAQQLAAEPTVLAPARKTPFRMTPRLSYALSAAASLSAVAVVAWVALSGNAPGTSNAPGLIAQNPAPVVATPANVPNLPATGGAHDYMLAHQGVSPSTALQGVAPYVRTVSMSRDNGGR